MNRRGFLKLFGAGVAGIGLEKAIPFGRVWSFPKRIALVDLESRYVKPAAIALVDEMNIALVTACGLPRNGNYLLSLEEVDRECVETLKRNLLVTGYGDEFEPGDYISIPAGRPDARR